MRTASLAGMVAVTMLAGVVGFDGVEIEAGATVRVPLSFARGLEHSGRARMATDDETAELEARDAAALEAATAAAIAAAGDDTSSTPAGDATGGELTTSTADAIAPAPHAPHARAHGRKAGAK